MPSFSMTRSLTRNIFMACLLRLTFVEEPLRATNNQLSSLRLGGLMAHKVAKRQETLSLQERHGPQIELTPQFSPHRCSLQSNKFPPLRETLPPFPYRITHTGLAQ